MSEILEIYRLGVVDYERGLEFQQERRDALLRGEGHPALFLLQHPPTITLGSLSQPEDLLVARHVLEERGVRVIETNRGGRVTYHGPGQLVGYPVIDLRAAVSSWCSGGSSGSESGGRAGPSGSSDEGLLPFPEARSGVGVREYLRGLEETMIRVLARMGLCGGRVEGAAGVWVGPHKIASIGVAVRRWITMHGFALNLSTNLSAYEVIRPCGFDGGVMTSVDRECGSAPYIDEVAEWVAAEFGGLFGFRAQAAGIWRRT